jgi:DNA-binding GntR family transcriptional regulator
MDKPKTRSEQVREEIEEHVATGRFPPGMRLDETELAERFGVSRTPLREALFQLASIGVIEMQPRRGAVVTEVPPHRLVEMFEVMAELEAMCGRLAARRMSAAEQQALVRAHHACESAVAEENADAYYYRNEQFHHAIYQGSHNDFLTEQAKALHRRLRPYRRLQLRVRNRIGSSFREHEGIVEAILAGDSELTEQRMRDHVLVQGERFADLIASLGRLAEGNIEPMPTSSPSRLTRQKALAKAPPPGGRARKLG